MYGLLQRKYNQKYFVGNPRSLKARKVKACLVVSYGNYSVLQEIARNLNRNVPQIKISPIKHEATKHLTVLAEAAKLLTASKQDELTQHHRVALQSPSTKLLSRYTFHGIGNDANKRGNGQVLGAPDQSSSQPLTNIDKPVEPPADIDQILQWKALDLDIADSQCKSTSRVFRKSPQTMVSLPTTSITASVASQVGCKTDDSEENISETSDRNLLLADALARVENYEDKDYNTGQSFAADPVNNEWTIVSSDNIVGSYVDVSTQLPFKNMMDRRETSDQADGDLDTLQPSDSSTSSNLVTAVVVRTAFNSEGQSEITVCKENLPITPLSNAAPSTIATASIIFHQPNDLDQSNKEIFNVRNKDLLPDGACEYNDNDKQNDMNESLLQASGQSSTVDPTILDQSAITPHSINNICVRVEEIILPRQIGNQLINPVKFESSLDRRIIGIEERLKTHCTQGEIAESAGKEVPITSELSLIDNDGKNRCMMIESGGAPVHGPTEVPPILAERFPTSQESNTRLRPVQTSPVSQQSMSLISVEASVISEEAREANCTDEGITETSGIKAVFCNALEKSDHDPGKNWNTCELIADCSGDHTEGVLSSDYVSETCMCESTKLPSTQIIVAHTSVDEFDAGLETFNTSDPSVRTVSASTTVIKTPSEHKKNDETSRTNGNVKKKNVSNPRDNNDNADSSVPVQPSLGFSIEPHQSLLSLESTDETTAQLLTQIESVETADQHIRLDKNNAEPVKSHEPKDLDRSGGKILIILTRDSPLDRTFENIEDDKQNHINENGMDGPSQALAEYAVKRNKIAEPSVGIDMGFVCVPTDPPIQIGNVLTIPESFDYKKATTESKGETESDPKVLLNTVAIRLPGTSSNSSGVSESVFMERESFQEADTSHGSLQTADYVGSMSFLLADGDEDWLPSDVQYEMTPLLSHILSASMNDEGTDQSDGKNSKITDEMNFGNEENMDRDNIRASHSRKHVVLSPITEVPRVPLPNLSDDSDDEESRQNRLTIISDIEENNDDSIADQDYNPADDSNHSDESENDMDDSRISRGSKKNVSSSKSANSSANGSRVLNVSDIAASGAVDNTDLIVQTSDMKKSTKKYFCVFCNKLYSKLPRHLENVHREENDVKKFALLPPGSDERKKVLNVLRKTGTFQFNTNPKFNTGEIIPTRRPDPKYRKMGSDYKTCASCLGTYSILNIRHHVAACRQDGIKYQRSVIVLGRTVEGRLHKEASAKLRLEIFPPLREDNIVRLIRYDRLLIVWGNKLCLRYIPHYQHNMIRARLRLMGRLLLTAKIVNPNLTDFASLYNPKIYNDVLQAVRIVGRYDEKEGEFGAPSIGMNLGTYIKQIGAILVNEYVKSDEPEKERKVEQFLKIFKVDFAVDVNNAALETQRKNQRQRKVILPSTDDIRKLSTYLDEEMKCSFELLLETYSYEEWFKLSEITMAAIITFNRRRTGEIQNILIDDYANPETIDENTDKELYASLSAEAKAIANRYTRISIRGKKGRPVRVLLYPQLVKNLNLLLKYRGKKFADVPARNKYLFGIPSSNKKRIKVVDACEAMRKYSGRCGADIPENLRGTKLRKHIATQVQHLNLNDNDIADLANFMGHSEKIHREVYRQPIKNREILGISRLLEAALGEEADTDSDSDNDDTSNDHQPFQTNETNATEEDNEVNDEQEPLDSIDNASIASSIATADEESPQLRKHTVKRRAENANADYSSKRNKVDAARNTKQSKKRKYSEKTIPDGNTRNAKKRAWSQEEVNLVKTAFSEHLKNRRLPSFAEILELKNQHPEVLGERTRPQIKTWINNRNKAAAKGVGNSKKAKKGSN